MPLIQTPISSTFVSAVRLAGDSLPLAITAIRSQISKSSSSSSEITRIAVAGVAQIDQRLPDEGGGTDVHAPRRLRDHQQLRLLQHFAAHDVLLQVAARTATLPPPAGPPHFTLNLSMHSAREGLDRLEIDEAVLAASRAGAR